MSVPVNNFAGLSTDLGLGAFPAIDEHKYPDIYSVFVQTFNAIRNLQQILDLYVSPLAAAITSEAIPAGAMVNFYSVAGVLIARNASAVDGTKPCHAFAGTSVGSGATGQFQTTGTNQLIGGLTPGTLYFLSDGSPGNITATMPTIAGHLVQAIGVAISDQMLIFNPSSNWKQL